MRKISNGSSNWRLFAASAFWLLAVPAVLQAHPHMWLVAHVSFLFDARGLAGFYEDWLFDDYNSHDIIQSFDANHDGRFDSAEIASIKTGYFDNIKDYSYFTVIRTPGRVSSPSSVTRFWAGIEAGRVRYRFFVPLRLDAARTTQTVMVAVFDPTFFVDFSFASGPIPILGARTDLRVSPRVVDDRQDRFAIPPDLYLSQAAPAFPTAAEVSFRRVS